MTGSAPAIEIVRPDPELRRARRRRLDRPHRRDGECFGCSGPNGAGQDDDDSAARHAPAGADRAGRACSGSTSRRKAMAVRRLLGYVPQQLSIEGALTGRENVDAGSPGSSTSRAASGAARVDEVLAMMDLTEAADRMAATTPAAWSAGWSWRRRWSTARRCSCSTSRPSASTRWPATACGRGSRELQRQYGTTVLLTTHYMEEADALCDRVASCTRGRLRAVGAPDELKAALGPGRQPRGRLPPPHRRPARRPRRREACVESVALGGRPAAWAEPATGAVLGPAAGVAGRHLLPGRAAEAPPRPQRSCSPG